jgi:anti-sigma-K factor RskA
MVLDLHDSFRENIPAYALDALDAEEAVALESHLKTCTACQAELSEYHAVGDALLAAIPPKSPSAALRRRLQSRLPSAQKSKRPRLNWSFSQVAMAAALVLLLAMNLYSILQVRTLQLEQTRLARQYRTGQTVLSMLSYPTTQRLAINSDNVVGSLLLDEDRDIVALIVWNMPELTENQTYQIWLIDPQGGRVSAGIFRPESDQAYTTQIVFPQQSLSNFTGIGVTVEPAGGSAAPTGERMFKVDF